MSKRNVNRRRAIKLVAGGVVVATIALPSKWTRPIVESVVVPAHAQASPPVTTATATTVPPTTAAPTTVSPTTTFAVP
jgi:hypothetical protein